MARRFTITKGHHDAFSQQQRERFAREVFAQLRDRFQEECSGLNDTELETLIREGIDRARRYSIVAERDVAQYILLMVMHSRELDEEPGVREILQANWIPAPDKIARVSRQLQAPSSAPPTSVPDGVVGSAVLVPSGKVPADLDIEVVDTEGNNPIAGARVYASGPEFRAAVSDHRGVARLSGIAPGEYRIAARHSEQLAGSGRVLVDEDGARTIIVCRRL